MKQTTLDLQMALSENFTLMEFVRSQTAERYGVRNMPSWNHVLALRNLCQQVLQPLRNHFGPIRINSGFRCERLNELVHGVGNPHHLPRNRYPYTSRNRNRSVPSEYLATATRRPPG